MALAITLWLLSVMFLIMAGVHWDNNGQVSNEKSRQYMWLGVSIAIITSLIYSIMDFFL